MFKLIILWRANKMELTAGDSKLTYNEGNHSVVIEGSMRLPNLTEYTGILKFLTTVSAINKVLLTLDFTKLNFLNSSGITTLSMFIISVKKNGSPRIKVLGIKDIPWQEKSLPNFHKLWNDVEICIEGRN